MVVAILAAIVSGIAAPEIPFPREESWYSFSDATIVGDGVPSPELSTELYKRIVSVVVTKCGNRSDFESLHDVIRSHLSRPLRHPVVVFYYLPGQDTDGGMYARTTDPSLDSGFDYGTFVTGTPPGDGTNWTGREAWALDLSTTEYVQVCDESGALFRALPVTANTSEEQDDEKAAEDHGTEAAADRLLAGKWYSVGAELPFMPARNASDDPQWMENMRWSPPGLAFRVDAVDQSRWPRWYRVSWNDGTAVYWLNSTALVGKEITTHER